MDPYFGWTQTQLPLPSTTRGVQLKPADQASNLKIDPLLTITPVPTSSLAEHINTSPCLEEEKKQQKTMCIWMASVVTHDVSVVQSVQLEPQQEEGGVGGQSKVTTYTN